MRSASESASASDMLIAPISLIMPPSTVLEVLAVMLSLAAENIANTLGGFS